MGRTLGVHQAALYAAEAQSIAGLGMQWRRTAPAQAYVDGLVGSGWFFDRWPFFVRCAIERRGAGSVWSASHPLDADGPGGRPTEGVILVADGSLSQPVVLHELAHLLLPHGAGHGSRFAQTLLALVRHEMGFFAFAALHDALRRSDGFGAVDEVTQIGERSTLGEIRAPDLSAS